MSVIKDAFAVNARLSIPQTGDNLLSLEVRVDDAKVREQVPEFDGMENVFVLVPKEATDGTVSWDRRPLEYKKTEGLRDLHALSLTAVDATAVARYGVAVGLDSNGSNVEVWAQGEGDNYRAKILQPAPRPSPKGAGFASTSKMLAAQGSRIIDALDDKNLVKFAAAQAAVRDALTAKDAAGDEGLARLASATAAMLDVVQDLMWTPIDANLRGSLTSYERTLTNLARAVKNFRGSDRHSQAQA